MKSKEDKFLEKIQTEAKVRHHKLIPNDMKRKELSLKSVSETLKKRLGDKPNILQLEEDTGVGRYAIKSMITGENDYKVSNLFKLCNELKIDLLK